MSPPRRDSLSFRLLPERLGWSHSIRKGSLAEGIAGGLMFESSLGFLPLSGCLFMSADICEFADSNLCSRYAFSLSGLALNKIIKRGFWAKIFPKTGSYGSLNFVNKNSIKACMQEFTTNYTKIRESLMSTLLWKMSKFLSGSKSAATDL